MASLWTKNKVVLFLYFAHNGINFHRYIKPIYLSALLNFAAIQNDPKQAEMKYLDPQPATTIREQLLFTMFTTRQFLASPLLTEEAWFTWEFFKWVYLIYLRIFQMGFTFQAFKRVQGSVSIKTAWKGNIWLHVVY